MNHKIHRDLLADTVLQQRICNWVRQCLQENILDSRFSSKLCIQKFKCVHWEMVGSTRHLGSSPAVVSWPFWDAIAVRSFPSACDLTYHSIAYTPPGTLATPAVRVKLKVTKPRSRQQSQGQGQRPYKVKVKCPRPAVPVRPKICIKPNDEMLQILHNPNNPIIVDLSCNENTLINFNQTQ